MDDLENIYKTQLKKRAKYTIDREEYEKEIKEIEISLENDQHFEHEYISAINKLNLNEIVNQNEKYRQLMQEIKNSQEQIQRIHLKIQQQHKLMDELKQQIDTIQIRDQP